MTLARGLGFKQLLDFHFLVYHVTSRLSTPLL